MIRGAGVAGVTGGASPGSGVDTGVVGGGGVADGGISDKTVSDKTAADGTTSVTARVDLLGARAIRSSSAKLAPIS